MSITHDASENGRTLFGGLMQQDKVGIHGMDIPDGATRPGANFCVDEVCQLYMTQGRWEK